MAAIGPFVPDPRYEARFEAVSSLNNRDFESLEAESQISRSGSREMLDISTTGVNRTGPEGGPEACCSQAFNFMVANHYYMVTGNS